MMKECFEPENAEKNGYGLTNPTHPSKIERERVSSMEESPEIKETSIPSTNVEILSLDDSWISVLKEDIRLPLEKQGFLRIYKNGTIRPEEFGSQIEDWG